MTIRRRSCALIAACLGATLLLHPAGAAQDRPGAEPLQQVALTFDDLPAHGPLPRGLTRLDLTRRIVEALRRHGVPPVYGFINARQLQDDPTHLDVLRVWREAGFPLANHTFSHMDLHANATDAFERDVAANESALQSLMGSGDWRWFRYPYLREGDTPEKYRAVRAYLNARGYRIAQVTVSFDDYAYNEPYARCLAANDAEGVAWLERSYLRRASESLVRGRDQAREIFGRDISHVMLLHVGGFQTVMLPKLLDLLRERGVTIITLEEAQRDAAYAAVPEGRTSWSGTFLDQMRRDPAPRSIAADDPFRDLAALCRTSPAAR